MFGTDPKRLREDLRERRDPDVRRRRDIVLLSILGMANMAAGALVQTGLLRRLPNPRVNGFDSNKVILSDQAYVLGAPDAAVATASLAANLPLAGYGEADRAERQPLAPIAAAAKSMADVAAAAWYFAQMRLKLKTWCAYCLAGGAINLAIFALTIPEARKALRELADRRAILADPRSRLHPCDVGLRPRSDSPQGAS